MNQAAEERTGQPLRSEGPCTSVKGQVVVVTTDSLSHIVLAENLEPVLRPGLEQRHEAAVIEDEEFEARELSLQGQ